MPFDADAVAGARLVQQAPPVWVGEGSGDRDGGVIADQPVATENTGRRFDEVIGEGVSVQIVDEPSFFRAAVDPTQKIHELFVTEVMGEQ